MWSPTLLAFERAHVVHLAWWGVVSLALGLALVIVLRLRRADAALASYFGLNMAVWGLGELLVAWFRWRGLAERDYASALRLGVHLRLAMVGEAWVIAGGVMLLCAGGLLLRRLSFSGAGIAWTVHGLALLFLDRALLERLTHGG